MLGYVAASGKEEHCEAFLPCFQSGHRRPEGPCEYVRCIEPIDMCKHYIGVMGDTVWRHGVMG
jgi:hypothetical protein